MTAELDGLFVVIGAKARVPLLSFVSDVQPPFGDMTPWSLKPCLVKQHAWQEVLNVNNKSQGKACLICGLYNPVHRVSHLDVEESKFRNTPYLWIQWKGTSVCCDVHCQCGASLHFDGDFFYFFKCMHCGQVWESGTHVAIYPVTDHRADGAVIEELE